MEILSSLKRLPFMRNQPRTLLDLSRDLHDPQVESVLSIFQERTVSRNRVIALLLIIAWSMYWYWRGPGEPDSAAAFNHPQAQAVIPLLLPMLILSVVWWLAVRYRLAGHSDWADAVGAVANFVGVAIILPYSWNLNCLTIVWLPMACINIGARYTTIPFILSVLASVAIAVFAAPPHYWEARPYFAVFTLLLIVGLPLSVHRLLLAIRVVTEAAIRARDAHSRFVGTVSHELRTPLNSVVNATELLESETDPKRKNQLIELLSNNALVLRNRVNAVLDARSIESGRVAIINEAFTFNGILKTLSGVVSPTAGAKHIELTMEAGSAGDIVLRSDPARVEQVLTNLLVNAVKFTPEGGRVDLNVHAPGVDQQGRVLIEAVVKDNGIGIPDEAKAHIFDPFYQVSAGPKRSHEGVGLGLHIVQSMAQLLQGKVTVEDNPGGGSLFRWVVPMARAAATERPNKILAFKEAIAAHRHRVRPMRVLVIDDNASNREIAQRMLHMAGHTMVAASTGEQGIREAEQSRFDLILLDLHMPGLSGWEVLNHFRNAASSSGMRVPPIVVLSADATTNAMSEAKQLGAIGYLMKPVAGPRLLNILEDVSGGDKPGESLAIVEVKKDASVAEPQESWLDFLRSEGNADTIQRFIHTCIEGIEGHLASLTISIAASERDQSIYHLHCIKNELLQLGEEDGVALCQTLRTSVLNSDEEPDVSAVVAYAQMIKAKLESTIESVSQVDRAVA